MSFQVRLVDDWHELRADPVPEQAPTVCGLWAKGGTWTVLYVSQLPTCTTCRQALTDHQTKEPTT